MHNLTIKEGILIDTGSFLIDEKTYIIECKMCHIKFKLPNAELYIPWTGTGKFNDPKTQLRQSILGKVLTQVFANHYLVCTEKKKLEKNLHNEYTKRISN
jgi:hypothetical protein